MILGLSISIGQPSPKSKCSLWFITGAKEDIANLYPLVTRQPFFIGIIPFDLLDNSVFRNLVQSIDNLYANIYAYSCQVNPTASGYAYIVKKDCI